ncbi:putative ABC transporter ATP-binding protein [compost metagenome]
MSIGYMPQNYDDIMEDHIDVIDFIRTQHTKEEETLARTYLGSMKFTKEEMLGKIGSLSGGQKAKLFIVKLILQKNNVLFLDEPTRNLSPLSNPVIRKTLSNYTGAIFSISHDRKYINEVCNKVYKLTKIGLEIDGKYTR